jgi:hypothetical protein
MSCQAHHVVAHYKKKVGHCSDPKACCSGLIPCLTSSAMSLSSSARDHIPRRRIGSSAPSTCRSLWTCSQVCTSLLMYQLCAQCVHTSCCLSVNETLVRRCISYDLVVHMFASATCMEPAASKNVVQILLHQTTS